MINGNGIFSYVATSTGVNSDGEKYLILEVLTKSTKKKVN